MALRFFFVLGFPKHDFSPLFLPLFSPLFDIHPSLGMLFWEALAFLILSLKLHSLLCGCLSVIWLFENVMFFFLRFLLRLFLNSFTNDTKNPKSRLPSSSVICGSQEEALENFCYRFVSCLICFSSRLLRGY